MYIANMKYDEKKVILNNFRTIKKSKKINSEITFW